MAHEAQADGRLEDDGLPLDAADIAGRTGIATDVVRACLMLFVAWGEAGGWLRQDAEGCYVVADLEPLSPAEKDARRKAQAAARTQRWRQKTVGDVTPGVTPTVTGSVTGTVTVASRSDVTGASRCDARRDARRDAPVTLSRAGASDTETETKTSENTPPSPLVGEQLALKVGTDDTPYAAIVSHWNETAGAAGAVVCRVVPRASTAAGKKLRARIKARWKERADLAAWRADFEAVAADDWSCGRKPANDGRIYRIDLEAALQPGRLERIAARVLSPPGPGTNGNGKPRETVYYDPAKDELWQRKAIPPPPEVDHYFDRSAAGDAL